MIIIITSYLLNILLLNIVNINYPLLFPMFIISTLISSFYFREKIIKSITILLLYIALSGLLIFPILYFIIIKKYLIKDRYYYNLKDYLFKITKSLIIFDILFFLLKNTYNLNLLTYKIFITIPINIFYSLLLFKLNIVLKNKNHNIK